MMDMGDESVAPSNDDFFTDEEKNAINRCRIQINNNTGGIYSHQNMLRAIENVGTTSSKNWIRMTVTVDTDIA